MVNRTHDRSVVWTALRDIDRDTKPIRRTEEPTRTVRELLARIDGEIPDLTVARPSLEDIYLDMIGSLR